MIKCKLLGHAWGLWYAGTQYRMYRGCKRCGELEIRNTPRHIAREIVRKELGEIHNKQA